MKVVLINMPFADTNRPSISLTQLKCILDQKGLAETEILYLNQDFAEYFKPEVFRLIAAQYTAGLGDWLFRKIAFPDCPDNADRYFRRHFPQRDPKTRELLDWMLARRDGLDDFFNELIKQYHLDQCDFAGFTSMFSQNVASFALAKKLKDRNREIVTGMGGANCESPMGQELVRNVPQIDFVFSGPALVSFPKLMTHLAAGNQEACHQIRGVFSKQNVDLLGGRDVAGDELPLDVPIPLDYRSFVEAHDERFPETKNLKILTFETSRGCWWGERSHCTFCGLNGDTMVYRAMSPDRAIEQFNRLFEYAGDFRRFSCVDNILPRNYAKEVFPKIEPPSNIDLFYEVKADLTQDEMRILSGKRVKSVQPGIEALATSTLKLMKKGTSAFGNITFLKHCVLYDIFPEWNLLVGFPGETEDVFQKYLEDIPLLVHVPPPSGSYPVRFDRFSPYFTKAQEYGLALKPYDFYKQIYPFDQDSIANVAYYFQDHNYGADYIRAMSRWIGKLQVAVAGWNSRWDGENSVFPELYFEDGEGSDTVYDSRSGEPIRHKIGETGRRVLDLLNKPTSVTSVARAFADVPGFDAEKEIDNLGAKQLIFHEGSRYLNLVLPKQGSRLKAQRTHTMN